MKDKRLTNEELQDYISRVLVQLEPTLSQETISVIQEVLEYRTKIEQGLIIELPKKCYQVIWVLGWEIYEYDIVEIKYDYKKDITVLKAVRSNITEIFTSDNHMIGRRLGEEVFLTKAEAEKKLQKLKEV